MKEGDYMKKIIISILIGIILISGGLYLIKVNKVKNEPLPEFEHRNDEELITPTILLSPTPTATVKQKQNLPTSTPSPTALPTEKTVSQPVNNTYQYNVVFPTSALLPTPRPTSIPAPTQKPDNTALIESLQRQLNLVLANCISQLQLLLDQTQTEINNFTAEMGRRGIYGGGDYDNGIQAIKDRYYNYILPIQVRCDNDIASYEAQITALQ